MKRLLLFTVILSSLFASCKKDKIAPPHQGDAFVKYYGNVKDQKASDIKQTSDGGFILLGASNSYSNSDFNDYFLVKTDSFGNEMWSKTFGADGSVNFDEQGIAVLVLADDEGYLVAGNRREIVFLGGGQPSLGDSKIVLYKIDLEGVIIWEKTIRDNPSVSYSDFIADIKQIPSGGFILIGETSLVTAKPETPQYGCFDKTDIVYMKLDDDGNLLGQFTRGFIGEDRGVSVEVVNNGFIIVGRESPRTGGTNCSGATPNGIFGKRILCARVRADNLQEVWFNNFDQIESVYPDIKLEAAHSCLDTTNTSGQNIITIIAHVDPNLVNPGSKDGELLVLKIPEDGNWLSTDLAFFGKNTGTAGISHDMEAAAISIVPPQIQGDNPDFILTATHRVGASGNVGAECYLMKLNYDLVPLWDDARFFGNPNVANQWLSGNEAGRVLPLEELVPGTTRKELTGYAFTGTFNLGTNSMIGLIKTNTIGTLTPEPE